MDVGLIVLWGRLQIKEVRIKRQPNRHAGKTCIRIIKASPSSESSDEIGYIE